MKRTLIFALGGFLALSAAAQSSATDAAWCDVIQQALSDFGHSSTVRSDLQDGRRVVHVMTSNRTYNYRLPDRALSPDFSSPINIIVDEPDYRTAYRGDYSPAYRGDARSWMGPHSSVYMPTDVFTLSSDIDLLESSLRSAVASVPRVQLVDGQYVNNARRKDASVFELRTTVIALQHGESYAKGTTTTSEANKPHQQGDRNHNNGNAYRQQDNRKVERRYAYGKLHLELVDCRSGAVVWSADVQKDDNTSSTWSNPMEDVVKNLTSQVHNHLQRLYPSVAPRASVLGEVLRVCSEKKNKVESLYVGLGSNQRLRKGDVLTVYAVSNVSGHRGRQQIGSVSVTEVQGPDLCICKVKKGDKDIFNAIQAGQQLEVQGALD